MNVPGLGEVEKDERFGWYSSRPMKLAVLGGEESKIVLEGYDEDPNKNDFHIAIANLISSSPAVLKEAEPYIYQYYQDISHYYSASDKNFVSIKSPAEVWAHVQLGAEPVVSRRSYGDKGIYVSLECSCDWEPEHGLQIVFKDGSTLCKVGPFDGHLTNSDAFADAKLENVIYRILA